MPPKSILKKPTDGGSQAGPAARDDRNRQIALHHAQLIQQQKDVESEIFKNIEALLDSPSSATADPANPSATDAQNFKSMIAAFQPTDYDSLIEERQAAGLCGYALCSRSPKKQDTKAKFRILQSTGRIVETQKLEQWCSQDCAKRALYVRVQLSEEPAWTRRADLEVQIKLYGEGKKPTISGDDSAVESAQAALSSLSLERGEKPTSARSTGLIQNNIVEKKVIKSAEPPTASDPKHSAIEGYAPKADLKKPLENGNDDNDNQDWDI